MEFLAKIGFNPQQAEDFIDDYEKNALRVKQAMEKTGKFSESDQFKQITERLRERVYGSDEDAKENKPLHDILQSP
jgi:hypothetical protein